MSFDYGAEPVSGGKSFKNPTTGKHMALLRSIIHLGQYAEEFKGKVKAIAPQVVAIFELKEDDDFEEDGSTPLTIAKQFPLRKGDKAFLTKFENVFLREGDTGLHDFIGRPCELDLTGSKELGEDKLPKYINVGAVTALHPKLAKTVGELSVKGVGHCKFKDLTKEAIEELHPIRDVADVLLSERNESYRGSKVEAIIAAIRKENPEFAVRKAGDAKPQSQEEQPDSPDTPENPPAALSADEEF